MATRRARIVSSPGNMTNARLANVPSLALVPLTELRTVRRDGPPLAMTGTQRLARRTDFAGCGAGETSRTRAARRCNRAFARRCDRLHRRGDAAARGWPAVSERCRSPTDGRCGRAISPARRPMRRCRCRRRRSGSKRVTSCRTDCDCVIDEDAIERLGAMFQVVAEAIPGEGIRRAGEDIAPGETLVAVGQRITQADVMIARAAGRDALRVRRPRVRVVNVPANDGRSVSAEFIAASARASWCAGDTHQRKRARRSLHRFRHRRRYRRPDIAGRRQRCRTWRCRGHGAWPRAGKSSRMGLRCAPDARRRSDGSARRLSSSFRARQRTRSPCGAPSSSRCWTG